MPNYNPRVVRLYLMQYLFSNDIYLFHCESNYVVAHFFKLKLVCPTLLAYI